MRVKTVENMRWSDEELISHIRAGNRNAFEQLYRDHSGGIYCNLRKLTRDDDLAKELLQDVFIKVWEKKAVLRSDKPFRFYLFGMARNTLTDFYRKVKRDKQMLQNLQLLASEITHQPIESIVTGAEEELLLQAVDSLPPQRKKVFVLCKLEGKSYEEVSKLLGISTSTIGDHIVKGIKSIKNQLLSPDRVLLVLGISMVISFVEYVWQKIF
ncbi:RNA polymerase sigma factor [Pedobacter cryoconitis]|uniref:RNA polymerase sigma-70 factor (ECF subfamily) n=1 Tax=Pedobacter cryoconitis TaxID=188932 RepID=A0A7X0J073_9SPHI|nr:sigma-70 family RNA polymerase sigma factor [Pedobacter cryoconitis]MBB6498309.1 RNA polymerase sigma-70 factor (ECF subfamily) [Pedobacter cryoconitis]